MAKEFKGLYEFGEFHLDAAERRLVRGDEPIALTLKVFDTLLFLVQHSGHLVGKDELMKEVWSDSFVEEANVARHVWILRRALGDDEGDHRYIETVPKLGYRFIAPVREIGNPTVLSVVDQRGSSPTVREGSTTIMGASIESDVIAPTHLEHPLVGPAKQRRTIPVGAKLAAVLAVLAIALLAYAFVFRPAPAASEATIKSLAILPLKSLSGDANDDYLGLGIADSIITKVSQPGTITVRPTSAVRKYTGQQLDSLQVAQQLKVDSVLDGTVQRSGDRLRVSVNLLRAQDGASLWAQTFNVQLNDIFKMQDDVSQQVATQLRVKLRTTKRDHIVNASAYDLYMKAKFHAGLQNASDNDAAIELLERAISVDPNFAAAYADLGTEYRDKGFSLSPQDKEWGEKAFIAVNKALSLDPDLAEAHVSRAILLWTPGKGFPHETVIQEFRQALDLNPNLDEAHHQLANVYNHIGLLDKGQDEIQKALAINPANEGARYRVGVNLTYQGKYSQALSAFGEPNKFNPGIRAYQMAWVLFQLGRRDEAAALVEKYLKEYPQDEGGVLTSMTAMLAASAGDTKRSLNHIERAAEIGKGYGHFHHTAYAIASAYALMNKRDLAVKWLTAAADDGFPCYPLFERDQNLNNLRADPKFVAFMKRLKEQWEHYKETL